MINGLVYKNLIEKVVRESGDLPMVTHGRIETCNMHCEDCDLYTPRTTNCTVTFIKWFYKEADAPKLLTNGEKNFLEFLSKGYIYRTYGETFYLEDEVYPYDPTINVKLICISEEYGLYFNALSYNRFYTVEELKQSPWNEK